MERLRSQFDEMEKLVSNGGDFLERRVVEISAWSIAEHLDHLTKVCRRVLLLVLRGEPISGGGINPLGRLVLFTGYIPRGRGKSPENVRGERRTQDELRSALADCRDAFEKLQEKRALLSEPKRIFPHPFFGGLTRRQSVRFLGIHNHHHLKIIRDISRR